LLSYWQASLTRGRFEDLSKILNPVIRGWINYYGAFRQSALYPVLKHINKALQKWVRRKYKNISKSKERARKWLKQVAQKKPGLFKHWQMGIISD